MLSVSGPNATDSWRPNARTKKLSARRRTCLEWSTLLRKSVSRFAKTSKAIPRKHSTLSPSAIAGPTVTNSADHLRKRAK